MKNLQFVRKSGQAIESVLDTLAALRMVVFRDYPYLYEGSIEYERAYLNTYVQSERSFLCAAFDGQRMIGATTCIPLADETAEVQAPFQEAGFQLEEVFYFGESILLPEYRGLGLGHRFFEEREAHATSFGTFNTTCFCAVVRPENHPLRPESYRPLDDFWLKRGYTKEPRLISRFSWPDIGSTENTTKDMVYWTKSIAR